MIGTIEILKMSIFGRPAKMFQDINLETMTLQIKIKADQINLPVLFLLLPTTTDYIQPGAHLKYKSENGNKKLILPEELNKPGVIISMRYGSSKRGIVRSNKGSLSMKQINLDIGTDQKIIGLGLSENYMALTGCKSFEQGQTAANYLFENIRFVKYILKIIYNNLDSYQLIKQIFLDYIQKDIIDQDQIDQVISQSEEIWTLFDYLQARLISDDPQQKMSAIDYLEFFGTVDELINNPVKLYTGKLKIKEINSQMINLSFYLGYSIDKTKMRSVFEQYNFFSVAPENVKYASPLIIKHFYHRSEAHQGKSKTCRHTIKVNRTGYVKITGSNLELMEPIYYYFMKICLEHDQDFSINTPDPKSFQRSNKSYSKQAYTKLLAKEIQAREYIMQFQLPEILIKDNQEIDQNQDPEDEIKSESDQIKEFLELDEVDQGCVRANARARAPLSKSRVAQIRAR